MKLIKSLLLGTAAGLAATAGVQAADLPSKKAAPVDYVRVCTIGSFTGFVIPGSDICLKVGGFVRYQYTYGQPQHAFYYVPGSPFIYNGVTGRSINNGSGQTATASIKLDARTTTEYGLLRSFADMRISQSSPQVLGGGGQSAAIDKAYIQFGPWSFGKFQSFFDFYADAYNNIGALGSDTSVVGAAYSFNFGNGFFITAALEDRSQLGFNGQPIPSVATAAGVGTAVSVFGNAVSTNGYRVPDGVLQLLYDPGANGWGSAQLSGAIHNARVAYTVPFGLFNGGDVGDSKVGWAVQGGVKLNLGMLGAGDSAYIQAAYAQGALSYLGVGSNAPANGALTSNVVSNQVIAADAFAVTTGQTKLSDGFNVLAAVDHYWTPNFDTALWGSYTKVNNPGAPLFGSGGFVTAPDYYYWQVGAQANWVPVKGIKFMGTVNYYNIQRSNAVQDYPTLAGVTYYTGKKSADGIQAAIRIQRDF
ncbi:MAG: porin [Alsobacter sp.]